MKKNSKKVFVGLSGGVDSSVSALLLKNAGYQVTGVFIKGWQPDWIPCTWKDDRISAMRTAAYLDIPFLTLDLEREYKEKVVNYILDEYKKGRTPNPDMLCNREIKFGKFLTWAKEMGADYVATGHYAQNIKGVMHNSVDKDKDQTYFLSQLSDKNLQSILFPIGHLWKKEVRKIAEENKLPVATRKDSQGICFVGDLEMKDFLKRELKPERGNVLDLNGNIIGTHDGAILYTLGERHGFNISNKNTTSQKHYIVSKDISKNILVVSDEESKDENFTKFILLKDFSFSVKEEEVNGDKLTIMVRYRGEKIRILKIQNVEDCLEIELEKEVLVSKGQFGVIYKKDICCGGGVIS